VAAGPPAVLISDAGPSARLPAVAAGQGENRRRPVPALAGDPLWPREFAERLTAGLALRRPRPILCPGLVIRRVFVFSAAPNRRELAISRSLPPMILLLISTSRPRCVACRLGAGGNRCRRHAGGGCAGGFWAASGVLAFFFRRRDGPRPRSLALLDGRKAACPPPSASRGEGGGGGSPAPLVGYAGPPRRPPCDRHFRLNRQSCPTTSVA